MASQREYRPFPRENRRDEIHSWGEVPLMLTLLELPMGARILELGCGPAATLIPIAKMLDPKQLVGLDTDRALLNIAKDRLVASGTEAELVHADARHVPFADQSFDMVLDFGTCYHIARADDALREAARVLVPGGLFVTETRLNQILSHPVRAMGKSMPWANVPELKPAFKTLMWEVRAR